MEILNVTINYIFLGEITTSEYEVFNYNDDCVRSLILLFLENSNDYEKLLNNLNNHEEEDEEDYYYLFKYINKILKINKIVEIKLTLGNFSKTFNKLEKGTPMYETVENFIKN